MSSILTKPFSWANKIIRAAFKGAPNLLTTSDLNRQLEAFKKEMYVLQQGSGVVISDLWVTERNYGVYEVTGSYIFCAGVRFDLAINETITVLENSRLELRLYAKKSLVTYADDFSKEISGAKFSDNTTQPAADHYVYTEAKVLAVPTSGPNVNFEYSGSGDFEYVTTLGVFESVPKPAMATFPSLYYYQLYTTHMGSNLLNMGIKSGYFRQFTLPTVDTLPRDLVPAVNDTWQDSVHKLWSRLYTLEKRFFQETTRGDSMIDSMMSYNGMSFPNNRRFLKVYDTLPAEFGACELYYNFHIVGNICFVAGRTVFEKNTAADPLKQIVSFTIGTADNEIPHSLYYTDTSCALIIQNNPEIENAATALNSKGYIDRNKMYFSGIPAAGCTLEWYATYCFSSKKFWKNSVDDRYGNFNDMR